MADSEWGGLCECGMRGCDSWNRSAQGEALWSLAERGGHYIPVSNFGEGLPLDLGMYALPHRFQGTVSPS